MKETVLVFGGTSFIGMNLIRRLIASGYDVVTTYRPGSAKYEKLYAMFQNKIQYVEVDLCNMQTSIKIAASLNSGSPNGNRFIFRKNALQFLDIVFFMLFKFYSVLFFPDICRNMRTIKDFSDTDNGKTALCQNTCQAVCRKIINMLHIYIKISAVRIDRMSVRDVKIPHTTGL